MILAASVKPDEFSMHLCTCPKRPLAREKQTRYKTESLVSEVLQSLEFSAGVGVGVLGNVPESLISSLRGGSLHSPVTSEGLFFL